MSTKRAIVQIWLELLQKAWIRRYQFTNPETQMKVSIRTAYRIVKKTEDPDSDPIFIPQYQEEGSEDWHTFDNYVGSGGYNPVYFYVLSKAVDYLERQKALEDVVVHYKDDESEWTKSLP